MPGAGYNLAPMEVQQTESKDQRGFERGGSATLVQEFFGFLSANKMWWMAPILIVALLLAGVVVLGSTGAAPFIYTLF